jgi:hypothetical protein
MAHRAVEVVDAESGERHTLNRWRPPQGLGSVRSLAEAISGA